MCLYTYMDTYIHLISTIYYTFVLFPKEFPPTLGLHFSSLLLSHIWMQDAVLSKQPEIVDTHVLPIAII